MLDVGDTGDTSSKGCCSVSSWLSLELLEPTSNPVSCWIFCCELCNDGVNEAKLMDGLIFPVRRSIFCLLCLG